MYHQCCIQSRIQLESVSRQTTSGVYIHVPLQMLVPAYLTLPVAVDAAELAVDEALTDEEATTTADVDASVVDTATALVVGVLVALTTVVLALTTEVLLAFAVVDALVTRVLEAGA